MSQVLFAELKAKLYAMNEYEEIIIRKKIFWNIAIKGICIFFGFWKDVD